MNVAAPYRMAMERISIAEIYWNLYFGLVLCKPFIILMVIAEEI